MNEFLSDSDQHYRRKQMSRSYKKGMLIHAILSPWFRQEYQNETNFTVYYNGGRVFKDLNEYIKWNTRRWTDGRYTSSVGWPDGSGPKGYNSYNDVHGQNLRPYAKRQTARLIRRSMVPKLIRNELKEYWNECLTEIPNVLSSADKDAGDNHEPR